MKRELELGKMVLDDSPRSSRNLRKRVRDALLTPLVCSILASLGIFGGISSLFVGLICVVIHSVISHDQVFDRVGTVLLIVAIPMILIGSIFLDEIKTKK